ncbi:hypothetical protein CEUSTIGMA_g2895.t1, partial [Chlamydomonas eustigma]
MECQQQQFVNFHLLNQSLDHSNIRDQAPEANNCSLVALTVKLCHATGTGCKEVLAAPDLSSLKKNSVWRTRWPKTSPAESSCVVEFKKEHLEDDIFIQVVFSSHQTVPRSANLLLGAKPSGPFEMACLQPLSLPPSTKQKLILNSDSLRPTNRFLKIEFSGTQCHLQGMHSVALLSFSQYHVAAAARQPNKSISSLPPSSELTLNRSRGYLSSSVTAESETQVLLTPNSMISGGLQKPVMPNKLGSTRGKSGEECYGSGSEDISIALQAQEQLEKRLPHVMSPGTTYQQALQHVMSPGTTAYQQALQHAKIAAATMKAPLSSNLDQLIGGRKSLDMAPVPAEGLNPKPSVSSGNNPASMSIHPHYMHLSTTTSVRVHTTPIAIIQAQPEQRQSDAHSGAPAVNPSQPLCASGAPAVNPSQPLCASGAPAVNPSQPLCASGAPAVNPSQPLCASGAPAVNPSQPLCASSVKFQGSQADHSACQRVLSQQDAFQGTTGTSYVAACEVSREPLPSVAELPDRKGDLHSASKDAYKDPASSSLPARQLHGVGSADSSLSALAALASGSTQPRQQIIGSMSTPKRPSLPSNTRFQNLPDKSIQNLPDKSIQNLPDKSILKAVEAAVVQEAVDSAVVDTAVPPLQLKVAPIINMRYGKPPLSAICNMDVVTPVAPRSHSIIKPSEIDSIPSPFLTYTAAGAKAAPPPPPPGPPPPPPAAMTTSAAAGARTAAAAPPPGPP